MTAPGLELQLRRFRSIFSSTRGEQRHRADERDQHTRWWLRRVVRGGEERRRRGVHFNRISVQLFWILSMVFEPTFGFNLPQTSKSPATVPLIAAAAAPSPLLRNLRLRARCASAAACR